MTFAIIVDAAALLAVAMPAILLIVVGGSCLIYRPLGERAIAFVTQWIVVSGLAASITVLLAMLIGGSRHVAIDIGNWVFLPGHHSEIRGPGSPFHFHLKLVFDRLSVPFIILSYLLCGIVGAFASRYLHREPGFRRFFLSFALFLLGMVVTSAAGTIEVLFFGWELVGLSSALLVAFFHERITPVRNGLRIWAIYRLADASFLAAAVVLHHLAGQGEFDRMIAAGTWPFNEPSLLSSSQALIVGLLLVIAAAGKSALIPFSGWLSRAMEGPTPSSAIFYGALSVHLGAFLLLRISPLLDQSWMLSALVVVLGLATAFAAAVIAQGQADIKGSLAFASLTQVGIIVAEIGFGLRYIALIHIIGHAFLRTMQLLRAPTLLHDYHTLENAIGDHLQHPPSLLAKLTPESIRRGCYRFAFERGGFDNFLDKWIVTPFWRFWTCLDSWERAWTGFLAGDSMRISDAVETHEEVIEGLRL